MAEKLNISYSTYQRIESGETTSWATHLENISSILEVPIEEIIVEKSKLKQVNKDNSTGYLAENQNIILSDKLIEQYEIRIKEKEAIITELKEKLSKLNKDF